MSSEAPAPSSAQPQHQQPFKAHTQGAGLPARAISRAEVHLRYALTGLILGTALAFLGFDSYDEVHRMFTFADFRLLFAFLGAVTLLWFGFFGLKSARALPRRPFHPGIIPGSLLFGIGWAMTGACPAIALVQLGGGRLYGLVTLAGILIGTWGYSRVHGRIFRWDVGSCDSSS